MIKKYSSLEIFSLKPDKKAELLEQMGYSFNQVIDEVISILEIEEDIDLPDGTSEFYISMKEKGFSTKQIIEDLLKTIEGYDKKEIN